MNGQWGEPYETWEGDGAGGVAFDTPSGGTVFVTRWTDRGVPKRATEQDWAEARLILAAAKALAEREGAS